MMAFQIVACRAVGRPSWRQQMKARLMPGRVGAVGGGRTVGQGDLEHRALGVAPDQLQAAAMAIDKFPGDGETEAGAAAFDRA